MVDGRRCRFCHAPLGRDSAERRCGVCKAARRSRLDRPPSVPAELWETAEMQAAFASRHMGKVLRAYRQHRLHEQAVTQDDLAAWALTTQAQISRLENGGPLLRLDQLAYWARLLRIPREHLWFELPDDPPAVVPGRTPYPRARTNRATDAPDPRPSAEPLPPPPTPPRHPGSPLREPERPPGGYVTPGGIPLTDDEYAEASTLPNPPIRIDMGQAQQARMADYVRGGDVNFDVDREVVDYAARPLPGGLESARATAEASQWFQSRVVRFLVREAGLRQILFVGPTMPTDVRIQEVINDAASDSRAAFVIDDDTVMAHAHRLRQGAPETRAYVRGSLHQPDQFLWQVARVIDFGRPVAVVMNATLHSIVDDAAAHRCVRHVMGAVPSGSYLALSHLASDLLGDAITQVQQLLYELSAQAKTPPMTFRTRDELAGFLAGMELLEPGIVPLDQWRPDDTTPSTDQPMVFVYAAVARKP